MTQRCPTCGGELVLRASFDRTTDDDPGPLQGHWLDCESCEFRRVVAIIQYPGAAYETILEPSEGECDECAASASWEIQRSAEPKEYYCGDCVDQYYRDNFKRAVITLDKQQ